MSLSSTYNTLVRRPALKLHLKRHVMLYPKSIQVPAYYQSLKTHLLKLHLRAGLQWTLAKLVIKIEPITTEMLDARWYSAGCYYFRLPLRYVVDHDLFTRFCWLPSFWWAHKLRPCDFELQAEVMSIQIVCSKTDRLCQGDRLVVARTRTPTCLVAMLEQYFARTGMSAKDERFLFQPIQHTKMVRGWGEQEN